MTADGEPAKMLLPYLQRADELQKHDHLAAYYCRLYAMERGLSIPAKERTNETKLILVSLMSQLEKDKKVVKLSPDDNMYMEGFAQRVFAKADKQDRADRADLKTSMTFYAASIFFEILLQFGELPPDIQEKQKYASWKAVDIRKAVAEGRKPVPGPPVAEKDILDGDDTTWGTEGNTSSPFETQKSISPPNDSSFNLPSATSNSIPPSHNQNPYADNRGYTDSSPYPHTSGTPFDNLGGNAGVPGPPTIGTYSYSSDPPGFTSSPAPGFSQDWQGGPPQEDPVQYHQQWPSSASVYPSVFPSAPATPLYPPHGASRHSEPPARTSSAPGGPEGYQLNGNYDSDYQPSAEQVVEAHKASRFAVSALAFDDVPTAISHLRKSLELLTSPSSIQ